MLSVKGEAGSSEINSPASPPCNEGESPFKKDEKEVAKKEDPPRVVTEARTRLLDRWEPVTR